MKKLFKLAAASALFLGLAGCGSADNADAVNETDSSEGLTVLKVGATTSPHAIILEEAVAPMKEAGYDLVIVPFSDYPQINPSTTDGSLDANYFQHQPYLDSYNSDAGLEEGAEGYLVSAGAIHYEPLGAYSNTLTEITEETLPDGAKIAVPNDATNEGRALNLLQDLGVLTLKADAGLEATVADIEDNPKNVQIVEVDAANTPAQLPDVDIAIVNGNYALAADITDKLIATEAADSDAAQTYQNIIAVKESKKDDAAIKKLVEILKSDDIKDFIKEEFGVSVVPAA